MTETELLSVALSNADRLKRFALRLCGDGDDADDLVQEGFLRALACRKQLRDEHRVLPWLLSIVRSVFLQKHRKSEHQLVLVEANAPPTESAVGNLEEELLRGTLTDEVAAALAALPEEWRTCLLLCVVDDFSYEEIAEVVGCELGTVGSRIARARARLLTSLHEHAAERGIGRGVRR